MEGEKTVLINCDLRCEAIGLTTYIDEEGFEDELEVCLYTNAGDRTYFSWRQRLGLIWNIIIGKTIIPFYMNVSKSEFKNKVADL